MAELGGNTPELQDPIDAPTLESIVPEEETPTPDTDYNMEPQTNPETGRNVLDTTDLCTINDKKTPILVLFGPSQCGKSMTMVRLVNYLRKMNFTVEPRIDFRPSNDKIYKERCLKFNSTIATYEPLPGTAWQDYMLATVYDKRRISVLQILEAPGEAYFSSHSEDPVNEEFPAYLNTINLVDAPKIWCFFIEPDWGLGKNDLYTERIKRMQQFIELRKDKIIFLYNKVDMKPHFIRYNKVDEKAVIKYANDQYPGLFDAFKNTRIIENIYRPYLCEFVPFSTGSYSGGKFSPSRDMYPEMLMKKILKRMF